MSTSFTAYGMATIMRSMFTPDVAAAPSNVQFAACFSVPVNNAASFQLDEPPMPPDDDDVGYMRAGMTMDSTFWAASDLGEMYNIATLSIGTPTMYWGPLYGWALVDIDSEECLVVGELIDPIDPVIGQAVVVPVASLVIGLYG